MKQGSLPLYSLLLFSAFAGRGKPNSIRAESVRCRIPRNVRMRMSLHPFMRKFLLIGAKGVESQFFKRSRPDVQAV